MRWISVLLALFVIPSRGLVLTATHNHSSAVLDQPKSPASASSRVKPRMHPPSALASTSSDGEASGDTMSRKLPKVFYTLNSSTKWLVSIAATVGVWSNPRSFRGPYIVVGSIVANYLAEFLKTAINQGRPDGAPFLDPGMPSTHAVVSFFLAIGWTTALGGFLGPCSGAAISVSLLRVICGYHTMPQIAVGGVLGSILGHTWMNLGNLMEQSNPKTTFAVAWFSYLVGSVFFIQRKVFKWLTEEKHL